MKAPDRGPGYASDVRSRILGGFLMVALVVAACGGASSPPASPSPAASPSSAGSPSAQGPSVIPVIVTVEQVVGPNRFLFSLLDPDTNQPLAAPDRPVTVGFTDPAGGTIPAADATFIWAIENERGVYVTYPTFSVPGTWKGSFTTMGTRGVAETINLSFDVREDGTTVAVGEQAPAVRTPTLADVGGDVMHVSTDQHPEPAFYAHSVDQLLNAGTPFLLAFATPKFCASAQCGPTLERVKAVAAQRPGFTVVNVEPYELELVDGSLEAKRSDQGQLIPVEASNAYGLVTEPWVFVIDGAGTIGGSFESIFTDEELLTAIDAANDASR
jgi:hypothetical protein